MNPLQKRKEQMETIEKIIDSTSLNDVIGMLADICVEKSQHISENWQDSKLAKMWNKNANTLNKITAKIYS